jgi:hypothetical protein
MSPTKVEGIEETRGAPLPILGTHANALSRSLDPAPRQPFRKSPASPRLHGTTRTSAEESARRTE